MHVKITALRTMDTYERLKQLDNAMCWPGHNEQSTFPYAYTNKGGHVIVRQKGTHAGHEGRKRLGT